MEDRAGREALEAEEFYAPAASCGLTLLRRQD